MPGAPSIPGAPFMPMPMPMPIPVPPIDMPMFIPVPAIDMAMAPLPAAAEDEDELFPELKAPILAPLKSTLLLIRVPRLAAIRLPRVFSSAADIISMNTILYLV